ncbi:hypothetical protein [Endozoicomonas sp.]|uniref:hypothetical protein n=1 Tax=Endozoicomonas sp. TaxID=1892382 RepID=UPI003839E7C4
MNQLNADDLALAMEIKQKKAQGYSTEKEEAELAEKLIIADRLSDEMDGQPLDVETVMIEMTALIVAITVGINNEQALSQSMLITGLILQRIRDNQNPVVHMTGSTH